MSRKMRKGLKAVAEGVECILEKLHEQTMMDCTHGACWKKVNVNRGRRSSANKTKESGQRKFASHS